MRTTPPSNAIHPNTPRRLESHHTKPRPAVIVSYMIAGLVAMLVAVCYAELATEVSYTGGTFVYACKLYGRGIGW